MATEHPSKQIMRAFWVGALITVGAVCIARNGQAADSQAWMISTRSAPRGAATDPADPRIRFWQLADNAWAVSDRKAFFAAGRAAVPTVFVIHGNQASSNDAVQIGCSVRRLLECTNPDRPFRLVIWSWPGERVCRGIRDDVQLKAHYSDIQAFYVAECLREVPADEPVTLIGYSFGARVITGALEMLGGGRVGRYQLTGAVVPHKAPWRAVLIAAALDAHWLSPGRRNGRAPGQLERMLVTSNPVDRVMRLYPHMYGRRGPEALGYCASGFWLTPEQQGTLQRLNVSNAVGRQHGWWHYWRSGALRAMLAEYALAP